MEVFYDCQTYLNDDFKDLEELDGSTGTADLQLEEFFERMALEGLLEELRRSGRSSAMKRRGSQLSLDSLGDVSSETTEEGDAWTSTTGSTIADADLVEPDVDTKTTRTWGLKLVSTPSLPLLPVDENRLFNGEEGPTVSDADLEEFLVLLEEDESKYASSGWKVTVDKQTESISYKSWCMDPPDGGPTQYRSKMVIEDCSAEHARDFFLDDVWRCEWDDSRVSCSVVEEWDQTGHQVTKWVRKFPLFLRDREYLASRRIWCIAEGTFHCVAKLTNHPSVPTNPNFIRVASFLSQWRLKPVPSRKLAGKFALEMINFHQEDSGLSRNLTKMAVSRGMWSFVLKLEKALRAYVSTGRNLRDSLPLFLIQADSRLLLQQAKDNCDESF